MTRSTSTNVRAANAAEIGDIRLLGESFLTALEAQAKSPKTVKTYGEAVTQLTDFLIAQGMPTAVANINREHLEAFVASLLRRSKVSTANNRYRALQQFFKFLLEEGEISSTPFARMKAPKVPEEPVPHVELDDLKKLIKTCGPKTLDNLRDEAMIRLFVDTGLRSQALVDLTVDNLDVRGRGATVVEKYRRTREVSFGAKTALALDRYLRARRQHKDASSPWLWVGSRGRVTDSGVRQMLERRSRAAGIQHVHPHMLRHTHATDWMRDGGSESSLMRNMGWRSPQMIRRYTAAAADELARDEHKRRALGDRL
jgi:site-specific recombinase XerD